MQTAIMQTLSTLLRKLEQGLAKYLFIQQVVDLSVVDSPSSN